MRMRKKKHSAERIEACAELLLKNPIECFGKEDEIFGKKCPMLLEIGCGKGDFARGLSKMHPEHGIIALERVPDVAMFALEKAKACAETRPDNLRFIIGDASNLSEWFPQKSIDIIYLNFSDPWPKKGHAKRRLTHRGFLENYRKLLKDGGKLIFKTDNAGLFDFSLEEFEACGLKIEWMTRDLHNSDRAEENVMTEYEKNFSEKGFSICSAEVHFN